MYIILCIKLNRRGNGLHLVLTPARLDEAQQGYFRCAGLTGPIGLYRFFCVHALLVGLSLIKVHKRPAFDGCFY